MTSLQFAHDLRFHDAYDDVGDWGGTVAIPCAREALQEIREIPFKAYGRRPDDYFKRQFLVGSSLRDDRQVRLHQVVRHEFPCLFPVVDGLPEKQAKFLFQCIAFHYLLTARYLHLLSGSELDENSRKAVEQAKKCPPSLFLLDAEDGRARQLRNCGDARFCPYCRSRLAKKSHAEIEKRVQTLNPDGILTVVLDFPIVLDGESARDSKLSLHRGLSQARAYVRDFADFLNARGGAYACTIGPHLEQQDCFNGSTVDSENETLDLRVGLIAGIDRQRIPQSAWIHHGEVLPAFSNAPFRFQGGEYQPQIKLSFPSGRRLREAVVGVWPSYSDDYEEVRAPLGILAAPPWYLAPWRQWLVARRAAAKVPMVTYWDDWKKLFTTGSRRRPPSPSQENLRRNRNRLLFDRIDRDTLRLWQVRPIVDQLTQQLGRTPGWVYLQRECRSRGIPISDRQARRLANSLRCTAQ